MSNFPDYTRTNNAAAVMRRVARILCLSTDLGQWNRFGQTDDEINQAICDILNDRENRMMNRLPQFNRRVSSITIPVSTQGGSRVAVPNDLRGTDLITPAYWDDMPVGMDPRVYLVTMEEFYAQCPSWRQSQVTALYPSFACIDQDSAGPELVVFPNLQQALTLLVVTRATAAKYVIADIDPTSTKYSQVPDPLIECLAQGVAADCAASLDGPTSKDSATCLVRYEDLMGEWIQYSVQPFWQARNQQWNRIGESRPQSFGGMLRPY